MCEKSCASSFSAGLCLLLLDTTFKRNISELCNVDIKGCSPQSKRKTSHKSPTEKYQGVNRWSWQVKVYILKSNRCKCLDHRSSLTVMITAPFSLAMFTLLIVVFIDLSSRVMITHNDVMNKQSTLIVSYF